MTPQLICKSLVVGAVLAVAAPTYSQPFQLGDDEVRVVNDDETGETECEDSELNQGQCWEFAFKTLQEALDAAGENEVIEEIWVAVHSVDGYVPSEANSVVEPEPRRRTFLLANGLRIYGGFEGGETERDERDPEVNITVLNGQLVIPSGCPDEDCFESSSCGCTECVDAVDDACPECDCTEGWTLECRLTAYAVCPLYYNVFHVVTGHAITASGGLDGFTITKGRADGNGYTGSQYHNGYVHDGEEVMGGGILIDADDITNENTGVVIARSRLEENIAIVGGGLATYASAGGEINPRLVNVQFLDNEAVSDGPDGTVSPDPGSGGGAWSGPDSRELWMNCLFAGNSAAADGGGMFMEIGTDDGITNCTFASNEAVGSGGGLYFREADESQQESAVPTRLANSIFWGNSDTNGTGTDADAQITIVQPDDEDAADDVTLFYSDIEDSGDNLPTHAVDGGGNLFEDPDFDDDPAYRLNSGSPCIDTGCNLALPADVADLDGDLDPVERTPDDLDMAPRVQAVGSDKRVDMGAYEATGSSTCVPDCSQPDCMININDFLGVLGHWGEECVPCDFAGNPGVGIDEFLEVLGSWGPCEVCSGYEPESIEEVVEDAGLDYPDDWDEFVDVMTDEEEEQSVKDNYLCWMEHYLDCHRSPLCIECSPCVMCPDDDPFGGH